MNIARKMMLLACVLCIGCSSDDVVRPKTAEKPVDVAFDFEGTPVTPFGGYDAGTYRGDNLIARAVVDLRVYLGAPDGGNWSPDFAALEMLGRYHGRAQSKWCAIDTALTHAKGVDCCDRDASFDTRTGFDYSYDEDGGMDASVVVSCGQRPSTWRIGDGLAAVGLRGLHAARPLTAAQLRREIANGRPVLVSTSADGAPGPLVIMAGWSPIAEGGDRFMLVREGVGWRWAAYVDIVEQREPWMVKWTDSWFRMSATGNGCVPHFDQDCGR